MTTVCMWEVYAGESDMFRVDFRSTHVHYLNNLEEDGKYKWWRNNLNEILVPVFPGQLRQIRKKLFHAVFVLDPATTFGLESIDMIISLYKNSFPVRFGALLFSSKYITYLENHSTKEDRDKFKDDMSDMIIRLFSYIKGNYGIEMAFKFLSNVNKLHIESDDDADDAHLELHRVESAFVETILPKVKSPPQEILLKLKKGPELKELSQESSKTVFKLGLSKIQCSLLMNGLFIDPAEEALLNALNDETQRLQEQVYFGQIKSHTDVLDKLLSEAGIQHYNPQIICDNKPRFISLAMFTFGEASILNGINYLHSPRIIDDLKPVTHLFSVDITLAIGIKLLRQGFNYLIEGSKDARVELKKRTKHIVEIIEEVKWEDVDPDMLTRKFISDIVMYVSSSMSMIERSSESARFEVLSAQHSAIILNNENSSIHIDAVLDPLCPTSQKLSGILRVLWKYIQPNMRIMLNPMSSLVDLPLKNYYRYVVPSMDDFRNTDSSINGPKAFFANMPLSKTLTMNLDVPEPWLVEPVLTVHDLDNIMIENLSDTRTLQAAFELEALVLTGHCSEKDHDPPRGLQLILGTKTSPHLVDTLVMANLGYWKMKVCSSLGSIVLQ
ncbi:hypothetical protein KIW84_075422 [Lathyrus oleraceus]|uniref:UGGT thioredoxin-like domain-containing protein n=1 Tax=Pisum sativum TaxID=3888 RepID=A0A9D4VTW4_PEA|nr:hypothetical protein KIW84_075422 [Pisum sativum]